MFEVLALLEGSRLEEQGDMAGAWGWYRAVLRTIHHVGQHGTVERRAIAQGWHVDLQGRLKTWAADPRTTPALLRQALDDVVACEVLAPSEAYTLKAEYLDVDRLLEAPDGPTVLPPGSWSTLIPSLDFRLSPGADGGALRDVSPVAAGAGTEPTGHPAGHRPLGGV